MVHNVHLAGVGYPVGHPVGVVHNVHLAGVGLDALEGLVRYWAVLDALEGLVRYWAVLDALVLVHALVSLDALVLVHALEGLDALVLARCDVAFGLGRRRDADRLSCSWLPVA